MKVIVLAIIAIAMTLAASAVRAVTPETAKTMCETFANDHPGEDRAKFISRCMSNLSIDPPARTTPSFPEAPLAAYPSPYGGDIYSLLGVVTSAWFIGAVLILYFIPTVVAVLRGKINRLAIFVLNLLLGWTYVGWVIALVWAAMHDRPVDNEEAVRHA